MIFQNLNNAVVDALLSEVFLSFEFKMIKLDKMKIYKNKNEDEYQQ